MGESVYAVVPAAGRSTRMGGRPKLLLPYGGTTVLGRVLAVLAAAPVDRTYVVLGAWRKEIEPVARAASAEVVFNPDFDRGMLSSVQAGFRALPPGPGAVFVVPGDHPDLTPEVYRRLLDVRSAGAAGLVLPQFRGRGGHPLLVDLRFREEIGRLDPEMGLRGLFDLHPGSVRRVPLEDPGVLLDLDTPDDYRRARPEKGKKPRPNSV
jgi:molybdenum cofactor cytidylyltransferase